jgi:hypothetical protein
LTVILLIAWLRRGTPLPTLDEAALDRAETLWDEEGPASYDLDLMIRGERPGPVHIEVRSGEVTAMTRDGVAPRQRRTWEYWTVPSQFDMMRRDLVGALDPAEGFNVPPDARVIMRARFDPQYGYPAHYQRSIPGTHNEVEWEITRFEVVSTQSDN